MARIKNISGEDREVPALNGRLVLAGQVVDVPAEDVYAFTQQTEVWAPSDAEATTADAEAAAAYDAVIAEIEAPDGPTPPAGNASRDEWAAYVVAAGLATEEQIDGVGRDELRDTYGSTADGSNA